MSNTPELKGAFGFDLADGHHHFLVVIPEKGNADSSVRVYECPRYAKENEEEIPVASTERVEFTLPIWDAISDKVRSSFNLRLKAGKRKLGRWHSGLNYLAPHYGKELVLLGWALEDLALEYTDRVFRNWRGLAPEERWWLYTTANAPFRQDSKKGRGIGWRKAVSIAFSENPLCDSAGESDVVTSPTSSNVLEPEREAATEMPSVSSAKKKIAGDGVAEPEASGIAAPSLNTQQTLFDL